nr:MAG TPA: hypothetical protein [Caudoviricetes sp.]
MKLSCLKFSKFEKFVLHGKQLRCHLRKSLLFYAYDPPF